MDVEWLHRELLPSWVGQAHDIGYTQDIQEALRWLRSGKARAVFRMQPPLFSQVLSRARAHRRMPGKTTYFYPKLLVGLVEYKF